MEAARRCQQAGADSIVCHLREDRRHILDADVHRLAKLRIPLNLEMSIAPSVVATALKAHPAQVTLVPERRQELTTEGGLDAVRLAPRLNRLIQQFQARDIAVSLFIDPEPRQVAAAAMLGAPIIELHTGAYANAATAAARLRACAALRHAAAQARRNGLAVAAGHGLDYDNVRPIARIKDIEELNIGFSIISRALWVGLPRAVKEMRNLIRR